jgi:hypothetical protein
MRLTREAVSMGTRVTLAGLLLGAATIAPLVASAQPSPTPPAPAATPGSATAPVEIKPGAKPAAAPAKEDVTKPKKIVSDRDPFVNMSGTSDSKITKSGAQKGKTVKAKAKEGPNGDKAKPDKEEVEIPPPNVTVQGILLSGTGNRAILTSPSMTYIVRQGDKLGDYKVSSVADKTVVFAFKDKTFKLKLKDEFGGVGTPKGAKGKK